MKSTLLFCLLATASLGQNKVPAEPLLKLVKGYAESVTKEDWTQYSGLFHSKIRPSTDIQERWKTHDAKVTISKAELLFQDQEIAIIRVTTEIKWTVPAPQVTVEEMGLTILRRETGKEAPTGLAAAKGDGWKIWDIKSLETKKK